MSIESIARVKLKHLQDRIDSILEADTTPFKNVPEVLDILTQSIRELSDRLEKAALLKNRAAIDTVAENINTKTLIYLPLIGMILRSTNVRNAFELLDPLQKLCEQLLGNNARLILSSEWDYIPFAYPQSIEDAPAYTFIGLPASETANLLILPLAGHEIGHSVWRAKNIDGPIYTTLDAKVQAEYASSLPEFERATPDYDPNDIIKKTVLDDAQDQSLGYAVRQSEEIFCDLLGLAIFGESFLEAFSYILSPSLGTRRSSDYPSLQRRAEILVKCANTKLGLSINTNFVNLFNQKPANWSSAHNFIIQVSDKVVFSIVEGIWSQVADVINSSNITQPDNSKARQIAARFVRGLPSSEVSSIGDVVNAVWFVFNQYSADVSVANIEDRLHLLNEMGLKTIEVLEYNRRLGVK